MEDCRMNQVVDPILADLSEERLRFVEATLSNDEASSDEELHAHFVANGLSTLAATRALHFRQHYLTNVYLDGHTPIRKSKHAILFDRVRQQFALAR